MVYRLGIRPRKYTLGFPKMNDIDAFYQSINILLSLQVNQDKLPSKKEVEAMKVLLSSPSWDETKLKVMAASYIPMFITYFPALLEEAINAQLDLCEDDIVQVFTLLSHTL
jgi:hypothetical protein